jgi:hypothetical protein
MKRATIAALALLSLLAAAAPAAAKTKSLHYQGETEEGRSVAFALTGKRISEIDSSILTTCVPTHGTPVTYSTEFDPPGSFALGKSRKATGTEYMAYKGDVTKNYEVTIRPGRRHLWIADMSINFSYEEVMYGGFGELEQRFYICQGNDSFSFRA